jgi:hypothetical protein
MTGFTAAAALPLLLQSPLLPLLPQPLLSLIGRRSTLQVSMAWQAPIAIATWLRGVLCKLPQQLCFTAAAAPAQRRVGVQCLDWVSTLPHLDASLYQRSADRGRRHLIALSDLA